MQKSELLKILDGYRIDSIGTYREIDSTNGDDYRSNIIIDKRYVLRINDAVMDEERLRSISRLCERYRQIGILTPALYKNTSGRYITEHGGRICYLSDYLDHDTADVLRSEIDMRVVEDEVLRSIGVFTSRYTGVDLSPVNSMWSIIDLAPLDIDVDEKQVNVDMLIEALEQLGETGLAGRVKRFNEAKRERIRSVYKRLPRCVIQGDLNFSNVLVSDGHFVGLIDFNMSGTEVNVNHFCCETTSAIREEDLISKDAKEIYADQIAQQDRKLRTIFENYALNALEKDIIEDYRSICLISQYPNVMAYLWSLKKDKAKVKEIIELILER